MMNGINNEIKIIFIWMVILSIIITPIGWQYKLLIMTIIFSMFHLIGTGVSEIKETLSEIIINQKIYGTSEDEYEKIANEMEAELKVEELKTKLQKPIHEHIAARLYLLYIFVFIIMAAILYLSEYPNLKNLLDTFN